MSSLAFRRRVDLNGPGTERRKRMGMVLEIANAVGTLLAVAWEIPRESVSASSSL